MRNSLCIIVVVLAALGPLTGCSKGGGAVAEAQYTGDPASDIFEAARVGDTDKLTQLLDADPGALNRLDPQGRTLLHIAVFYNQAEAVHLLVDRGMDPNIRDRSGATPLAALEESGRRADDSREAIVERGGISAS